MKEQRFNQFDSISDFFENVENRTNSRYYRLVDMFDRTEFYGLTNADIVKHKFSYPIGVAELAKFKEVEVERPVKVRYYNSLDGHDIDIDRMYENMDFLIDTIKKRKQPKVVDIYVNVTEACTVDYKAMLNKTYSVVKIIDHLESLGIRCSLTLVAVLEIKRERRSRGRISNVRDGHDTVVEVVVKNEHDTLNIGAICTTISPWFFRKWILKYYWGNFKNVCDTVGRVKSMPSEYRYKQNAIIIDLGECLTIDSANHKIETSNVE